MIKKLKDIIENSDVAQGLITAISESIPVACYPTMIHHSDFLLMPLNYVKGKLPESYYFKLPKYSELIGNPKRDLTIYFESFTTGNGPFMNEVNEVEVTNIDSVGQVPVYETMVGFKNYGRAIKYRYVILDGKPLITQQSEGETDISRKTEYKYKSNNGVITLHNSKIICSGKKIGGYGGITFPIYLGEGFLRNSEEVFEYDHSNPDMLKAYYHAKFQCRKYCPEHKRYEDHNESPDTVYAYLNEAKGSITYQGLKFLLSRRIEIKEKWELEFYYSDYEERRKRCEDLIKEIKYVFTDKGVLLEKREIRNSWNEK
ncbi:hypothetical protein J4214_05695 [Candidatus Woesearchaeota archaeon]|nr:hypothetical protein [Candidatus Woesearchaeota archaeon]